MAIPWLAALKAIPWGDVISHAPTVLEKARDLIDRKRAVNDVTTSSMATPNEPAAGEMNLEALTRRVHGAQQQIDQLHTQHEQMTQALTALAEQNTALLVMLGDLRAKHRAWMALMFCLLMTLIFWTVFHDFGVM